MLCAVCSVPWSGRGRGDGDESKRVPDVCGLSPSLSLHSDNSSFMLPRGSFTFHSLPLSRRPSLAPLIAPRPVTKHFNKNYRNLISTCYEYIHRNRAHTRSQIFSIHPQIRPIRLSCDSTLTESRVIRTHSYNRNVPLLT